MYAATSSVSKIGEALHLAISLSVHFKVLEIALAWKIALSPVNEIKSNTFFVTSY